jgi:hypothetical protein
VPVLGAPRPLDWRHGAVDEQAAGEDQVTDFRTTGRDLETSDIFASALPGYPDNLTYNGLGVVWVALPSARNSALEALAGWPWLRKVVQRMPSQLREQKPGRIAWFLAFNTDGQVVHDLQDPSESYGPVTSVTETNVRLYFGSIGTAAIGWVPTP